jgi:hypothetical protein
MYITSTPNPPQQRGYYIYGINSGTNPPPSDCTTQFITSTYSSNADIVIGNSATSPGAVFIPLNNMITLQPGNYLFTFGISTSGQSDFALTSSITSKAAAVAAIVPGTHFGSNQNVSFAPVTVIVSVGVVTNLYLVNFALNPILLGTGGSTIGQQYVMAYVNIVKIL